MTTQRNIRKVKSAGAADYIGVSTPTLARWRVMGTGPRYFKIGTKRQSQIVYDLDDVDKWLESQARRSTSDPGAEAAS